jgi:nicotinate phosphoribosyltransferase
MWSRGIVPREMILLVGDTVRAVRAFHAAMPPDIPRLAYADTFYDPPDEAVRVALALSNNLNGIILQAEMSDQAVTLDLLARVRAQLDLAGFPRVKIFISGAVTVEKIRAWKNERAPVDGYVVGDTIGASSPLPVAVEIREGDGKPLARRGQKEGTTPSFRLERVYPDE